MIQILKTLKPEMLIFRNKNKTQLKTYGINIQFRTLPMNSVDTESDGFWHETWK